MKDFKAVLIALLAGITLFSAFKYVSTLKEQFDLMNHVQQLNQQVADLEVEKKNIQQDLNKEKELYKALNEENSLLQNNLNLNKEELAKLNADLAVSEKEVEELNSQFSVVKAENQALREQIQSLNMEVAQAVEDKEKLQVRLSSIAELKKAIKELRRGMAKVKTEIETRTQKGKVTLGGNQGFLVRDGKPTYQAIVKIEVEPLPSANP